MGLYGNDMEKWDFKNDISESHADLGRDSRNDVESELTTNHNNRIFYRIIRKFKKFLKKI